MRETELPRVRDDRSSGAAPVISVVMSNYRGAAHLAPAMRAVLGQTEPRLELIVVDDASDDDSVAIARAIAATDQRVRVIASAVNCGPGRARNLALDAARGEWVGVVDSDDLIHPERLARLIAAAEAAGAGMVADDLVHFGGTEARTLLQARALCRPVMLKPIDFLRSQADPRVPSYGYLKAVIRRSTLGARRYDPALRVGEDFDLMLRLLIDGARFLLLPDPLYAYRRHPGSISHRLSADAAEAMLRAHEALPPLPDAQARRVAGAVGRQLGRTLRYERLVAAIKARDWADALPRLADPAMLTRLAASLRDRRNRSRRLAQEAAGLAGRVMIRAGSVPAMPAPGGAWAAPPSAAAAQIVGALRTGPDPAADLPADLPEWAVWLCRAVRG